MNDESIDVVVSGGSASGFIGVKSVQATTIVINNYSSSPTPSCLPDGPIAPCPYRGLLHFGPEEKDIFFGRELVTAQLCQLANRQALITILGASGSGKSSVVLAGLVPQLSTDALWKFTHFRVSHASDNDPFLALSLALTSLQGSRDTSTTNAYEMALALRTKKTKIHVIVDGIRRVSTPGTRILLIADQFEELFTLCTDETLRRDFLESFIETINVCNNASKLPMCTAMTLRADFMAEASSYRPLSDVMQGTTVILGPMTKDEVVRAIEEPARSQNVSFEPGLIEAILADVGKDTSKLALLEFALTQLWNKQENRRLTHKAYKEIGGVDKALAHHADSVLDRLSPTDQVRAKRVFTMLVRTSNGQQDTRRVARRSELEDNDWRLAQKLASETSRLAVTNLSATGETVELIHETLICNWHQLQNWIKEDRAFLIWRDQIRISLEIWQGSSEDEGALLRGIPLDCAESWLSQRKCDLTTDEIRFITNSMTLREEELTKKEQMAQELADAQREKLRAAEARLLAEQEKAVEAEGRAQAEADRARLAEARESDQKAAAKVRAYITKMLMIALACVVFLGYKGFIELSTASHNFGLALLAKAQTLTHEGKSTRAFLTAQRALEPSLITPYLPFEIHTLKPDTEAYIRALVLRDLNAGLARAPLMAIRHPNSIAVLDVQFHPTDNILATGSDDRIVRLIDGKSGKEMAQLLGHDDQVVSVIFHPGGHHLASSGFDGKIIIWDVHTHKQIKTMSEHQGYVYDVVYSPDSRWLASASTDKSIMIWDTHSYTQRNVLKGHDDWVVALAFSRNSKYMASAGADNQVILWEAAPNGQFKIAKRIRQHQDKVVGLDFSPDGKKLISVGFDKTARIWDVASGEEILKIQAGNDRLWKAKFHCDGDRFFTTGWDGTVRIWNTSDGQHIATVDGHNNWVYDLAFSPDCGRFATASQDGYLRVWSARDFVPMFISVKAHKGDVLTGAFSPDGNWFASGGQDSLAHVWSLDDDMIQERFTLKHTDHVMAVAFSQDGTMVASGGLDQAINILHLREPGIKTKIVTGHRITDLAFLFNGKVIASAGEDKLIRLWNVRDGSENFVLRGHDKAVQKIVQSNDGGVLASGSDDRTIRIWDLTRLSSQEKILQGHDNSIRGLAFQPGNSHLLASVSHDSSLRIWDLSSQKEISKLDGHAGQVSSIAFNPNNNLVATAGGDRAIRIWDLTQKKTVKILDTLTGIRGIFGFNSNGNLLAFDGGDGAIRMWKVNSAANKAPGNYSHTINGLELEFGGGGQ